jgi:hypothetical protein
MKADGFGDVASANRRATVQQQFGLIDSFRALCADSMRCCSISVLVVAWVQHSAVGALPKLVNLLKLIRWLEALQNSGYWT